MAMSRDMRARLLRGLREDGRGGYSSSGGGDGDDSGGQRECIDLGQRASVVGDTGIGVGESASGSAVAKTNGDAGNRVVVLVGHEHGESLGQLHSRRSRLIVAAGGGDLGGGPGKRVLGKDDGGGYAGGGGGDGDGCGVPGEGIELG